MSRLLLEFASLIGLVVILVSISFATFKVQRVEASGTIYIRADGSVEGTDKISNANNATYTFTDNIYGEIVIERSNIIVDGNRCTLQGNGTYMSKGICLSNINNVTIERTNIKGFDCGVYLLGSYYVTISDSTITNNTVGFCIQNSYYNRVIGNTMTENYRGLTLEDSDFNKISGNNIANNSGEAIFLHNWCTDNIISRNNLVNNAMGVFLWESVFGTIISENNITNNKWAGVDASSSWGGPSYGPVVSRNNITNNDCGVYLYGVGLHDCNISENNIENNSLGISISESEGHVVYHNNFINNSQQSYVYFGVDTWDGGYPSGGNYWSDYTGADVHIGSNQNETGSDGIGDAPYDIDASNQDHYPLIGIFSSFNATSEHYVQTICNSTISDFQFNGTAIMFNVTGVKGTTGFCRLCIPTALMNGTFEVFVNGTQVSYNLLPCSNETYTYLYFNYTHSTQEVIIIPELPSFLILPIFMTATLIAVIAYRRKRIDVR